MLTSSPAGDVLVSRTVALADRSVVTRARCSLNGRVIAEPGNIPFTHSSNVGARATAFEVDITPSDRYQLAARDGRRCSPGLVRA